MREITSHKVNECNDGLTITAVDGPGPGGASHHYQIINVSKQNTAPDADEVAVDIQFQNGAIKEVGTNGITHEALLAIVIDRLAGFQSGPFVCEENQTALVYLRNAMEVLHTRTSRRMTRGVEGTLAK